MCDHMFVVTGGPGSGKSTLIAELAERGYRTMPEAGRAIIMDHVRIDGPALPWGDRAVFAEAMLGWELRSWHEASDTRGPILMDRGIPDVIGYLRLNGLPVPSHIVRAAELYRYNGRVFVAPWWEEIFNQDAERKQTPVEARETCEVMIKTYTELRYHTITLPMVGIQERADFVAESLSEH